jgi:hypothetical protein
MYLGWILICFDFILVGCCCSVLLYNIAVVAAVCEARDTPLGLETIVPTQPIY